VNTFLQVVDNCHPCSRHFKFEHELADALKILYIQQMLKRGFPAGMSIYMTLSHTDEIIDGYITAIDQVFSEIADALRKGNVEKQLKGPVALSGFRRLV